MEKFNCQDSSLSPPVQASHKEPLTGGDLERGQHGSTLEIADLVSKYSKWYTNCSYRGA